MKWTKAKKAELTEHWMLGYTLNAIAQKMGRGLSRGAIQGASYRIPTLPRRPSPLGRIFYLRNTPTIIIPREPTIIPPPPLVIPVEENISETETVSVLEITPPAPLFIPETKPTLPLFSRKVDECKWPIGDPRDSDFRFCGEPSVPGKPYCPEHQKKSSDRTLPALSQKQIEDGIRKERAALAKYRGLP